MICSSTEKEQLKSELTFLRKRVAELEKEEKELKGIEEKHEIVFKSNNDILIVINKRGKILDVNEKLKEFGGYERTELVGNNIRLLTRMMGEKTIAIVVKNFIKIIAGINVSPYEVEMIRKDGSPVAVEVNAVAMKKEGKITGVLAILRDITERRQADQKLKESESYLSSLLDSIRSGIMVIDPDNHRIVEVNSYAAEMIGASKNKIVGRQCFSFVCIRNSRTCPVTESGETLDLSECVLLAADGRRIPILKSVTKIRRNGKLYLLESIVDITQRKEIEADYKSQKELTDRIIAGVPDAVLAIDDNLRIVLANESFCAYFKVKNNNAKDKNIREIIPTVRWAEIVSKVLSGDESRTHLEFRQLIAGSSKVFAANVLPMQKREALVVIHDITEERERQERLYLTDRLASVGEMASGVAHELNNPLTTIVGLSELMVHEGLQNDSMEDMKAIYSEAQRAAGIVRNLLAFARKHAPLWQATQINKVVDDVLKLRSYEHKINNISIQTQLGSDLPEIMLDHHQMQQVFLNIIINSETAMSDANGRGTLNIATQRINGHVRVSFTDDGPGIAKDILSRIFDPFFTTKEVGKGTGLGLSICYGIVHEHGGNIYAESEPGGGTTFVVELPVKG